MDWIKKALPFIGCILIGFAIGILINIPACNKPTSKIEYITVHDTVTITNTEEKTKIKYINRIDTFYQTVKGDTVYIVDLPIEYKEYCDTVQNDSSSTVLKVNYHGYNSAIDSIWLNHSYQRRNEVIVEKPKKFSWDITVGPYIGYGLNATPTNPMQVNHGFEIGIGVVIGPSWRIK